MGTRSRRTARQLPPRRELSDAQRARLAETAVSPWDPQEAAIADEAHRATLESLYEATRKRGLPLPGGFLLDPESIADRLLRPGALFPWQGPLAYHPLFGVLVGGGDGAARRRAVEAGSPSWTTRTPRLGPEQPVARSWPELIDYAFALGDALRRRYVLWIRIGERRPAGELDTGRWSRHRHAVEARSARRFGDLVAALGVHDAFDHGVTSVKVDDAGATTVVALDDEALVASDDTDVVDRVLRLVASAVELAIPHAFGGYREGGMPAAPARGLCYAFPAEHDAAHRVLVRRDGDAFRWCWAQEGRINAERRVEARRSPRGAAPWLDGASPRLLRALAGLGAFVAEPLRSVAGVRAWLAEARRGDWEAVLATIEARVGGLVLAPAFGLRAPNRLGPFMMLADRASLEPLGLNAPRARDEEETQVDIPEADFVPRPWPFVCREGIELAVVGYENPRIDAAICADAAGTLYFLDHEFDALIPRASDALAMLEKRALAAELYDHGCGVTAEAAFAVPLDVGHAVAEALDLTCVAEASDRVSSTYVKDGVALVLRHAHALQPATTIVFARAPMAAVDLAARLRGAVPDAPLYIRTSNTEASEARRLGFLESGLKNLEWVTDIRWDRRL